MGIQKMSPYKFIKSKYDNMTEEEETNLKMFCLGYHYELVIRGDLYNKDILEHYYEDREDYK